MLRQPASKPKARCSVSCFFGRTPRCNGISHAGRLPVLQHPGATCSKPPPPFRAACSFAAVWRRPAVAVASPRRLELRAACPTANALLQAVDQAVDKAAENKDKIVAGVKSVGLRCAGLKPHRCRGCWRRLELRFPCPRRPGPRPVWATRLTALPRRWTRWVLPRAEAGTATTGSTWVLGTSRSCQQLRQSAACHSWSPGLPCRCMTSAAPSPDMLCPRFLSAGSV